MRINNYKDVWNASQFIILNDKNWLENQKHAGKCVAKCLKTAKKLIDDQTPNLSLLDIEAECEKIISGMECVPTFKGYKGFPGAVCLSVNKQLVHGIPTKYVLKPGDIVKVDLGATYHDGVMADAALTTSYGPVLNPIHDVLLKATEGALMAGINAISVGKRIGCIGYAIHNYSKKFGFGLITKYGGHALSRNKVHSPPFISNKSSVNEGVIIQPGLSIAIEPMLVIGDTKTFVLNDKWTVCGMGISAHYEHTVFIHKDRIEIMTQDNDAKY